MRSSKFVLGLGAVAIGLGLAGASAAGLGDKQLALGGTEQAARVPDQSLGHSGGGLSALKSAPGSGTSDHALSASERTALQRPEGTRWSDGLQNLRR